MPKKLTYKNFKIGSPLFIVAIIVIFAVFAGYWSAHNLIVEPASVNRVVTGTVRTMPVLRTMPPSPPQGCEYRQIKCVTEPCDPILVCNDINLPSPSATVSASSTPYPSTTPLSSCIPRPSCLDAAIPCRVVAPLNGEFCPPPKPSSPIASTVPLSCHHSVGELLIARPCGNNSYSAIKYKCRSESTQRVLTASECINYSTIMSQIDAACQRVCEANHL